MAARQNTPATGYDNLIQVINTNVNRKMAQWSNAFHNTFRDSTRDVTKEVTSIGYSVKSLLNSECTGDTSDTIQGVYINPKRYEVISDMYTNQRPMFDAMARWASAFNDEESLDKRIEILDQMWVRLRLIV